MEIPTSVDGSRADRHDTSDKGIRAAIRGQVAARTRQGVDNRQIAEELGIKESTVDPTTRTPRTC